MTTSLHDGGSHSPGETALWHSAAIVSVPLCAAMAFGDRLSLGATLVLLLILECCFLRFRQQASRALSEYVVADEHPVSAKETMRRSLTLFDDPHRWVRDWFLHDEGEEFEEARRDEVERFVAHSFFGHPKEELSKEQRTELQELVQMVEDKAGRPLLEQKRDSEVPFIRHTREPLRLHHQPFIVFAATYFLRSLCAGILTLAGFRRTVHADGMLAHWYRAARPARNGSDKGEAAPRPMCFLHGLGIGILPYLATIRECLKDGRGGTRAAVLMELPQVSLQLLPRVPSLDDVADVVEDALEMHGLEVRETAFVAHSFGSFVATRVAQRRGAKEMGRMVLISPVCVCLCVAHLTRMVLRGGVADERMNWIGRFFMSGELNTCAALSRVFWWYRVVFFADDFPSAGAVFFVGAKDVFLPVPQIMDYLRRTPKASVDFSAHSVHGSLCIDRALMRRIRLAIDD